MSKEPGKNVWSESGKEFKLHPISLEDVHKIIRELQGKVLTLEEAILIDKEQLKSVKDITNNYFSTAQSIAQDYAWGRYDICKNPGKE